MILADMGADVWKIEPVGISEQERGPGPVVNGANVYHFSVNRGKRALQLDLKSERGRELALRLAEHADVVTENFAPWTMRGLGLDYEAVSARNPRIIYASTSGFGQTGPDAQRGAVDVIIQGMSGLMSITGYPDGPPARAGYSIADLAGGTFTAIGVLGALIERGRSGRGQYIDVSMLDVQVALLEGAFSRYFATGNEPTRIGSRHPLLTPFQAFPTSDGYVVVANVKDWALFCALLGRDELVTDERFATNEDRTRNHAQLEPILNDAFSRKPSAHWLEALAPACLIAPLRTIAEVARDPHVNERGMFIDLPAREGASLKVSAPPLKYSRTPLRLDRGTPPPGADTQSLLRDVLGMDDATIDELARDGVIGVGGEVEGGGSLRVGPFG